jgi:hypothetical protein
VDDLEALTRDYRAAFLRYLPNRSEDARTSGYRIGRRAVVEGVSLLDLTQVHHVVLCEVLVESPTADLCHLTSAASEFLVEVLAPFDMTQRMLLDDTNAAGES